MKDEEFPISPAFLERFDRLERSIQGLYTLVDDLVKLAKEQGEIIAMYRSKEK